MSGVISDEASVDVGEAAAETWTTGVATTVSPAGRKAVADAAEASDGARVICTASAAARDVEEMATSMRTDAAPTVSRTALDDTLAALAKLAMIELRTEGV